MSEADKLRAAVKDLQERGLAPMHSTPENKAKAELSPFIKASKVVFDKSLELAGKVLGNSDRIAGAAVALISGVAGFASYIALGQSVGDQPAARLLFGDTPRAIQVLGETASFVALSFLHVAARNVMNRNKDLFNTEGL